MFIQRGKRFSKHVFLLFNDMFIHVQVRTCLYREVGDSLHMSSYCLMTCLYTYSLGHVYTDTGKDSK